MKGVTYWNEWGITFTTEAETRSLSCWESLDFMGEGYGTPATTRLSDRLSECRVNDRRLLTFAETGRVAASFGL